MRAVFQKIRSFPVLAGVFILLLQSYTLMHGCSNTAIAPEVTAGRRLYSSKCGSCHRLLPPEDHTADRWQSYIDTYGKKMTQEQKQIVFDYLQPRAADASNGQQELEQ